MSTDTVTVVERPTYVTVIDGDGPAETVVVSDESVTVVEVGIQGPQGPAGESGDANFTQSFNVRIQANAPVLFLIALCDCWRAGFKA